MIFITRSSFQARSTRSMSNRAVYLRDTEVASALSSQCHYIIPAPILLDRP